MDSFIENYEVEYSSSVLMATRLQAGRPENLSSFQGESKDVFVFVIVTKPAMKPTPCQVRWAHGYFAW
jgi:hypothetical protein